MTTPSNTPPAGEAADRDEGQAAPVEAVVLPKPCWWIDRDDDYEITHHPTRTVTEADHADRVRSDHGWVLSITGAFAIVPGTARQEMRRCFEVTCPDCGTPQHVQDRVRSCVGECGYEFVVEQIAVHDPAQTKLFEVLPTHDLPDQPLSLVVVFAEDDPR
jgi:hypothetical protein